MNLTEQQNRRIEALISRMTLEEKIGQMNLVYRRSCYFPFDGSVLYGSGSNDYKRVNFVT